MADEYHRYTLNDQNLVIKAEFVRKDGTIDGYYTFEYDSKGRLIDRKNEEGKSVEAFTWNDDDDVVEVVTGEGAYKTIITPSDQSIDHAFFLSPFGVSYEELFMQGYLGKAPKHLPAKESMSMDVPVSIKTDTDYKYTIVNGRLMGMEVHQVNETPLPLLNTDETKKYTFFWKEVE